MQLEYRYALVVIIDLCDIFRNKATTLPLVLYFFSHNTLSVLFPGAAAQSSLTRREQVEGTAAQGTERGEAKERDSLEAVGRGGEVHKDDRAGK